MTSLFRVAGSQNRSDSDAPSLEQRPEQLGQKHLFKEMQALGWGGTRGAAWPPSALKHNFC